jgi:inhibitor of the pro-sigma K processing machinery
MEMLYTVLLIAAVVVAAYVLIKILAAPIKKIFKLLINAVCGFALLFVANFIGGFFDFSIPINIITCIVAGAFGIPGVIFLVVVVYFMGRMG